MSQTADEIMRRARTWREENPDAWRMIEAYALNEAKAGRKFALRPVVERVRWVDIASFEGIKASIPNSCVAAFTRILEEEHPEMRGLITRKRSKLDGGA